MISVTGRCDAIEDGESGFRAAAYGVNWLAISLANEVISGPLARSLAPCETMRLSKALPFSSTKLTLLRSTLN